MPRTRWSPGQRTDREKPYIRPRLRQSGLFLANVEDEAGEARYVVDSVLDHREAGIALRRQAVLFCTAHHSDLLEVLAATGSIAMSTVL
jgi:superfamily I DNA/RNA helicase